MRSRLDFEIAELAGFREGTKYPAMDPKRRANEIEELEQKVERLRAEVDRLTPIVDDPEDVVDQHGWLPRDRREHTWWSYRLVRERKVRDLKRQVPELEAALKATTDRTERRERRAKLAEATRDLDCLIAEGPFTAAEMCPECPTPMAHHGWVWPPGRPCPAWPGWAARMREARQMLETFAMRREAETLVSTDPRPTANLVGVACDSLRRVVVPGQVGRKLGRLDLLLLRDGRHVAAIAGCLRRDGVRRVCSRRSQLAGRRFLTGV